MKPPILEHVAAAKPFGNQEPGHNGEQHSAQQPSPAAFGTAAQASPAQPSSPAQSLDLEAPYHVIPMSTCRHHGHRGAHM